jgi:hypothetical protein
MPVCNQERWSGCLLEYGSVAIRQIGRQALPQGVVAADILCTVRCDEDALDGTRETVIAPQMKLLHEWGEGVVFDSCR